MDGLRGLNLGAGLGLGSELLQGFGTGLQKLAHHKLNDLLREKEQQKHRNMFETGGYDPKTSEFLASLYANNPQGISKILEGLGGAYNQQAAIAPQEGAMQQAPQQPTFAQSFGTKKRADDRLKIEQYKDKLRPEINYLEDISNDIDSMIALVNKGNVKFGPVSSAKLSAPLGVGESLVNEDTGVFNTLSNKFVTDSANKTKGVRSVYHIKAIQAAKPSISKTKEQNLKILNHYKKEIDDKKKKFFNAHPYIAAENDIFGGNEPQAENASPAQKIEVVKRGDKYYAFNPETGKFDIPGRIAQ